MIPRSAKEIQELLKKGEISSSEVVNFFLKKIEKEDKDLGAFLSVYQERAIQKAKEIDQKKAQNKPLGKLAGIPIALKDNIHVKGEKTTCASKFLENYKAVFNATVTHLLEKEDAIILGKTNMDEFAMGSSTEHSCFFPAKNPWNLEHVPGGSSGGSAAAVAARFCPIALGSDTGGSIRQPASFCGIVGFKPTYGRVSRYGLVAFGSSLDQIGPFATSTEDIGLIMEVIGCHCPNDSTTLPQKNEDYLRHFKKDLKGIKIGVPFSFLENLSSSSQKMFESSLEVLKSLGAEIKEVTISSLKYSVPMYYILATAEASTNLARFDGIGFSRRSSKAETLDEVYEFSREEGFGKEVKRRILLGTYVLSEGYHDAFYTQAQKVRTKMIEEFQKTYQECDFVAFPTTPDSAFKSGSFPDPLEMYLQDIFTIPANLGGFPSISLPSGFDEKGLPLGLQLMGPQQQDVRLVAHAHAFEQATRFGEKAPPDRI